MEEFIYVIFEEQQLSCDRDYGDDGFMIIWDSDEVGRNLTTKQLLEEIKKLDDDTYEKVNKFIEKEICLNGLIEEEDLENYFEEIFEFLQETIGGGVFYRFYYQIVSKIKEIHKTEETAKKAVDYYTNNQSYTNKHTYVKYRLHT